MTGAAVPAPRKMQVAGAAPASKRGVRPPTGSTGRVALNEDPEAPIEGRDVDPEVLLHFRSTSDVVRYQPDPYHLKRLVTDLKNLREGASRHQVPQGFTRFV